MSSFDLFHETRLLFHALRHWSEALHRPESVTGAMRGVLEVLMRSGGLAVPAIARAQGVSRQHIQLQVDSLLQADLVERRPNPAHRRSPLIALNDKGRALVETFRAEERNALSKLQTGVSDEALRDAVGVMAAYRAALVSEGS